MVVLCDEMVAPPPSYMTQASRKDYVGVWVLSREVGLTLKEGVTIGNLEWVILPWWPKLSSATQNWQHNFTQSKGDLHGGRHIYL